MPEQGTPNQEEVQKITPKAEGQARLGERLVEKAKSIPEKVKGVIAQARGKDPLTALKDIAGASEGAEQNRSLTEKEIQQGGKALVTGIDSLFPENAKSYMYGRGTYNSYTELAKSGFSSIRAESIVQLNLSDNDKIVFNEEKDSYPLGKQGNSRDIALERQYLG